LERFDQRDTFPPCFPMPSLQKMKSLFLSAMFSDAFIANNEKIILIKKRKLVSRKFVPKIKNNILSRT
jgi:hypothetical protein